MDLTILLPTLEITNHISGLDNVPPDIKVCVDLVVRLYDDLKFLVGLLARNQAYLEGSPLEEKRVDNIISDATECLLDVGIELEACAFKTHGRKLPFSRRSGWGFLDSGRFVELNGGLERWCGVVSREIERLDRRKMQDDEGVKVGMEEWEVDDGDFENVELLRLTPRKSVIFGTSTSKSPNPPPFEEEKLGEGSGQALARKSVCSSHRFESETTLLRKSTSESRLSLAIDHDNESFSNPEIALQIPIPIDAIEASQQSLPQNQQLIRRPQSFSINVPPSEHNSLGLSFRQVHHQRSASSISSTSTRSRANTFTLQALRELEAEDNFSGSAASPSSASFMSSRVSTISSRSSMGSFGSLRSHGSLSRSTRRPHTRKRLMLIAEPGTATDDVDRGCEDGAVMELPVPSLEKSSMSGFTSSFPVDTSSSFHEKAISQEYLLGENVTSPLQYQGLMSGPGQLSTNEVLHGRKEVFEVLEDEDPEDAYFRDLKLQEIENKRRLAARQR